GIGSIAKCTQFLVPFMGILYMLGAFLVIGKNIGQVPAALIQMLIMAFSPKAVGGGLAGGMLVSAKEALRFGVSRGVFSNEAGLGASGISAAAADTEDYIKQGYISMTSVFLDTIVICSVTGLAYMVSGVFGCVDEKGAYVTGTALAIAAFRTVLGDYGAMFISVSIALFAFATIASWAYQGEKAFEYLFGGDKARMYYRFLYALVTFLGAVYSLEVVWNFADICNALMAIPNLICILVLSSEACREIKERPH
ncbi:MAG: alanine:cation symporter family protein, partial [Lachnospiraceae bacterium]|nr:alanine:cation symporter family protein [Lachnospiraceae bacterium]